MTRRSRATRSVGVQGAVEQALGAQGVKASGGLPFTGLDLALLAAGGGLLLVAGTGLRKLGKAKRLGSRPNRDWTARWRRDR